MKKVYLGILALNIANLSFGQVNFGIKAGANLSNAKINATVDKKAVLRFHAGGMLQTDLSDKMIFQPELIYSVKGFKAPSIYFAEEQDIVLNYLNIPILLGYRLNRRTTVLLGPEFGLLLSAKSKYDNINFDETKTYNKYDIGVNVSIATHLMKKIGIDLRYNYGIRSLGNVLVRDQNNNPTYNAKTANRVLQLSLFYQFLK